MYSLAPIRLVVSGIDCLHATVPYIQADSYTVQSVRSGYWSSVDDPSARSALLSDQRPRVLMAPSILQQCPRLLELEKFLIAKNRALRRVSRSEPDG